MITDILERIRALSTPEQGNVFRLFTYSETPGRVFYGIDSAAHPVFVIPSPHPMMRHQLQSTKKLILNSNLKCEALIDDIPTGMTVHILTCLSDATEEQEAFIRLTEAFTTHFTVDKPYIANELFSALVNLFAQAGKSAEIELQGLYAELYVIIYFYKKGVNLCDYWQKHDKLNFDFSISNFKRMEVKSTTHVERIHHFRHEQLLSNLYDIVIISLLLRKDDAGTSLLSLVEEVRLSFAQDFKTMLYIDRLIKNVPEDELHGLRYDDEYTKQHIRFYSAKKVPRFNDFQPDGVTHTEYNSDLSTAEYLSFDEFVSWIDIGGAK